MLSTTDQFPTRTWSPDGPRDPQQPNALLERYQEIVQNNRLHWTEHHRLIRRLGAGGQGVVYLSERRGADNFTLPLALKVFSPERYEDAREYDEAMDRIARISARVAQIQHDNLLDVHNFVDRNRIRILVMEWIDGYDVARLLRPDMLSRIRSRVTQRRWEYINRVVVTQGPTQPRIRPGVAVAIVRDCLAALAALHRDNIVHGDIKPSNIMCKRTGAAKIVDINSAFDPVKPPPVRTCTPTYAAPEVLDGGDITARSDLASLGYCLVEMLSGQNPFSGLGTVRELLEAKRMLPQRLYEYLPPEVTCNELLMDFCRYLIAPDPTLRFPSAEAADLVKQGAAAFHRQLILGNLAAEYDIEIRLWLQELRDLEEWDDAEPPSPVK